MAGTGHINAVNKVLEKNLNKTLQRRKDYKKSIVLGNSNSELNFKKTSKEELEKLKEKIRTDAKKEKKRNAIVFFILALLVLIIFYYLFSDFNIDFSIFSRHR